MDPNQRIGDYEILGELGSGGMGRVYRVRNVISDRVEAMKILLPDLVGRQELAERFLREIKLLAALNHPNIASLRTALTVDNQLIMIMEYVEGQSLAARLEHGPIATGDAVAYLDQVLSALHYAHERHVIHRDIKPANMMLTPQGVVKLMDFGIARSGNEPALTITGTTTGSLSYMSPEQVKGGSVDARSDLYSLGISLYEMVTGERPFQSNSDFGVMEAHLREAPRPPTALQPGLSSEVNDIILKAIAKDPAQRFQSAEEFREAIGRMRPPMPRVATASRNQTMIDSAVSAALLQDAPAIPPAHSVSEAPMAQNASDHARTIMDTRTPSRPVVQAARTNVPPPPIVPPPARRTSHPAVYMLLGGALVIAALIGAGLYIGRAEATPDKASKTKIADPMPPNGLVDQKPTGPARTAPPQSTSGASVVTPAAITDPANGRSSSVAGGGAVNATAPAGIKMKASAGATSGAADAAAPARPAEPEAAPQEAAKPSVNLDELEHEVDQLSARAGAVNNSLNRLQQQQERQGLGLRGDMAARQQGMNLNLSRAEEAINQRNGTRAQRYKALTEADVEALEKFLGR